VFTTLLIAIFLVELPFVLLSSILVSFGLQKAEIVTELLKSFNEWYKKVTTEKTQSMVFEKEGSLRKITTQIDPRPDALKSLNRELFSFKNTFEKNRLVFFLDPGNDPLVDSCINEQYNHILRHLENKSYKFICPPIFKEDDGKNLDELLDYYFPDFQLTTDEKQSLQASISSPAFFRDVLGLHEITGPCFVRTTGEQTESGVLYKVYHLPNSDKELLERSIDFYLFVIPAPPQYSRIQASVGNRDLDQDPNDPDYKFEVEAKDLSYSLQSEMEKELRLNKTKGAMRMLLFLLKQMKEYNIPADPTMGSFLSALQSDEEVKLSPIIITSSGKLVLSDYNVEIKLEPIHRAVYILFLQKTEGILFKDLPSYKNELMHIYSKISNRSSLSSMKKTIDELTNPYNNSMNEKCSRIRLAFLKVMDERVANHYLIGGNRNERKRIPLDRKLVIFEESVY
jgi:hypothetical protein